MKKIIANISWLFFEKIARTVLGTVVVIWIARHFGPDLFGVYNYILALVAVFSTFAGFGLHSLIVKELVQFPANSQKILGTVAVLQLITGTIAFILLFIFIVHFRPDDEFVKALTLIFGSILFFKSSDIALYWFEARVESKYVVWVQIICLVCFSIVKILLVVFNKSIFWFAWLALFESFILSLFYFLILDVKGFKLSRLNAEIHYAFKVIKNAWPLFFSAISVIIYLKIDQIMLGQMAGDKSVGIYSAAARVSEAFYFIPVMISVSIFPYFAELKKKDILKYHKKVQQMYDFIVIFAFITAISMTFASEKVVNLLFGSSYTTASVVLSVHIWASVFVFIGVVSGKWLLLENLQTVIFQRSVVGLVSNIFLNFYLIPIYGEVGAAVATLISYGLANLLYDLVREDTRNMFRMKIRSIFFLSALGGTFAKIYQKQN